MGRCGSEEFFRFELKPSGLTIRAAEILYSCKELESNSLIHVIFRSVSPKVLFWLRPIYNSPFLHERFALRVLKFGHLGKEGMQILNIRVTLLSEKSLTMNL